MKKILLSLAASVIGMTAVNAQLALLDFDSGLPSTWSTVKVDNNTPNTSYFTTSVINGLSANAWMNWYVGGTYDSSYLSVSYFNTPDFADRWLISPSFSVSDANTVLTWLDAEGVQGAVDSIQVWVSPTAGSSISSFTTMAYNMPVTNTDASGNLVYTRKGISLSSYNGLSIRIAFRNHTYNGGLIFIDSIQSKILANAVDAGVVSGSATPKMSVNPSNTIIGVVVQNDGATNITSLDVNYQLDAGTPVPASFTGLNISPYSTQTLNIPTQVNSPSVGSHTVTVNIINTNGAADPVAGNNTGSTSFVIATQSVPRHGLIEEFSSSTCVPCSALNATFDPIAINATNDANNPSTNFNLVRYQMNWPNPGTDASYNPAGVARRGYYGVTGIPDAFVNGVQGSLNSGSSSTDCQTEIDNSKLATAFMDITGVYNVDTVAKTLSGSVTVTPYFTFTGNYSVLIVAAERFYQNHANTTGQLNYYRVERMMFPNGNGNAVSSWTAGTPQTFNYSSPYIVGGVAQGNNHFWGSPANSDLVAFVQDNSDQTVLQSISLPGPTLAVKNVSGVNSFIVFPNPAKDMVNVSFDITKESSIVLNIVDALGRVVYTATQQYSAGNHLMNIPTSGLAPGLYNLSVQSESDVTTTQVSIVK